MLNLKLLNDWNGEYFMKKIIALFALFFIPAAAFAQNFDIEKNKYMIEKKANVAAQDKTRVVNHAISMQEEKTTVAKMLENAGTDMTSFNVAANHANIHINVLNGKYFGEKKTDAIVSLSLLSSGDSALVGNSQAIGAILNNLTKYYIKGTATDEEKCEIMLAIGFLANANYNVSYQGSTVGALALTGLYKVVVNPDEKASVRRSAIVALASIEKEAAVTKISSCISAINKEIGVFSKAWNDADEAFVFDSKGNLSDNGKDSDNAIVTALMLALEAQMDGAAKNKAIGLLKWYAGLTYNCKYYHQMRRDYESKGGSETTYLAALYILGSKSTFNDSPYLKSNVVLSHVNGRAVNTETGNAMKLLPIIEKEDGYECYTRRAFQEVYKTVAFQFTHTGQIYETGKPPVQPYYFDNCMKQKTDKIMMEITTSLLLGGVDGVIAKVVIKSAAKKLAMQAVGRAMYAAVTGTKTAKAASAVSTAMATYSERILQGVFNIHSKYGNYKTAKSVIETANK